MAQYAFNFVVEAEDEQQARELGFDDTDFYINFRAEVKEI